MNVSFLHAQFARVVWSGGHLALTLGDLLLAAREVFQVPRERVA